MLRRDVQVSDWLEIKHNGRTYIVAVEGLLNLYQGAQNVTPDEQVAGKTVRSTEGSQQAGKKDKGSLS